MRFNTMKKCGVAMLAVACGTKLAAQLLSPQSVDYAEFLRKHDFVYETFPQDYYSGAIMGNGLLGLNLYRQSDAYKFHIGRTDVTEGRMPKDKREYSNLYHGARLPIGYFLLKPVGRIGGDNLRLSLYNAEAAGRITTAKGTISLRTYVHAVRNAIVVETISEGSEAAYSWEFVPLRAISPRYVIGRNDYPKDYVNNPNPAPRIYDEGEFHLCVQNLVGGNTYVVAWTDTRNGSVRSIVATIAQDISEENAIRRAKQDIAATMDVVAGVKSHDKHRQWWHNYYPASFASFDDAAVEAFYWRQMYKLACLTRADGCVIDLQGPWAVEKTPWPAIWMNLNVQLTYSPLFTANRAELSKPLWKSLNDNLSNLILNAGYEDAAAIGRSTSYHMLSILNPNGDNKSLYETGNLMWILYYYYEYCRYQRDDEELLQRFFPLLKRSVAYYEHIREKRADGKYHLPATASPEYTTAKDCNYDLSLLRWGLTTLSSLNSIHKLNDEKAAAWEDFLENLTDYPADSAEGFMIGEGVRLTESHRHYSHLLMIYPLHLVQWEQSEYRSVIERSVAHWQSMRQYMQGYSFTGSASMYALMGDGERAAEQLHTLLNKYIQPNTLYREAGPVVETPLAAAATLQEMYLQSWHGIVRVFPAVPKAWQNASFTNFRAEGAFLISAKRENGATTLIQVESKKFARCLLQTNMNPDSIRIERLLGGEVDYNITDKTKGIVELRNLLNGDIVQISLRRK